MPTPRSPRLTRGRQGARVLLALCAAALVVAAVAGQAPVPPARVSQDDQAYMCPMHPDVVADTAGTCPRCRMQLVLGRPYDMRNYRVELRTTPAIVRPGEKTRLEIGVFHPGTGERILAFTEVHQKRFHLFVISQDMTFFEHVHPEQDDEGTWMIEVTLPKPGYYKVLSDFVPFGGSAQFVALPLVTAGYTGDLIEDSARLTADDNPSHTVGGLTATVTYDPPALMPAMHSHLTFKLTRAATSEAVTDLQPYLGAFGHILIVSEDLVHFVHSHPLEIPPPDSDFENMRGGPEVIFEAMMPEPGRYRAWAQFRRDDTVHTFPFTFEVGRNGDTVVSSTR
jgi:hypothetical protein